MSATLATLGLFALAACFDVGPDAGSASIVVTLDGVTWPTDTATERSCVSPSDTVAEISAGLDKSGRERILIEGVSLSVRGFPAVGQYSLGSPLSGNFGTFYREDDSTWLPWYTRGESPGILTISEVDSQDSTITGTFSFEAVTIPDTTPHHHLVGTFHVRTFAMPVDDGACAVASTFPSP